MPAFSNITGTFDVVGRRLLDAGIFAPGQPIRFRRPGEPLDPRWITELENRPGHVDSLLFVTGAKVNLASAWLLGTSVLFAADTDGLRPGTTWVVSLERALLR